MAWSVISFFLRAIGCEWMCGLFYDLSFILSLLSFCSSPLPYFFGVLYLMVCLAAFIDMYSIHTRIYRLFAVRVCFCLSGCVCVCMCVWMFCCFPATKNNFTYLIRIFIQRHRCCREIGTSLNLNESLRDRKHDEKEKREKRKNARTHTQIARTKLDVAR